MIVVGKFDGAWLYIVAPVLGGVVAALLYDRFIKKADKPTE